MTNPSTSPVPMENGSVKPEDLILRVIAELAHQNTFDGNFNAEPLALLLTFVKCPDDGLRSLVDGKLLQAGNRHHLVHFKAAYRITLFEVGKAIEAKITIPALWRYQVFDYVMEASQPKTVTMAALLKFLETLPESDK